MPAADNTVLARWVIALSEPLITTNKRVAIDNEIKYGLQHNPNHILTWFAGYLSTLTQTLPENDPWRNLTFTISNTTSNGNTPPVTYALSGNRQFGTRRDMTDMHIPEFDDWNLDLALAAVADNIPNESAALIAVANNGFLATLAATHQIIETLNPNKHDPHNILAAALTRVIHRRRTYKGLDDGFIVSTGFHWITMSARYLQDHETQFLHTVTQEIETNKITTKEYDNYSFH